MPGEKRFKMLRRNVEGDEGDSDKDEDEGSVDNIARAVCTRTGFHARVIY
jgi:hypothetical protein